MKHIQLLFAAMTFATTGFCQKGETAIEFNLTDLNDGWAVNVSRIDGSGGMSIYNDTVKNNERKFTIKCDSVTDNTYFMVGLSKNQYRTRSSYAMIYVKDGSTTTVSGSGMYPKHWTVKSQNPRQAFENKMTDAVKDYYKQIDDINFSADTVTSNKGRKKLYEITDDLFDKIQEKEMSIMKSLPVDEFWLENLRRSCGVINYEGNKYKYYKEVEELFNRLSDEQKATKTGKSIYLSLYGKAPATGDEINDYDLYDINGKVHHLADYKGKWLLLDFSSYYCGPCRMFGMALKYFYEHGLGKNFEIITITCDTKGQFEEMAAKEKYISPLFHDRDEKDGLFALNKIGAYPTFYTVNPEGKITEIFMGVDLGRIIAAAKKAGDFSPEYKTQNGVTVVKNPESANFGGLIIESVELYKDSTVVNVANMTYSIASHTTLRYDGGKKSCKILSSSIGFDKFTSYTDGMKSARLTFEPLPQNIKTFDFVEGDCERCFKIEGIKVRK